MSQRGKQRLICRKKKPLSLEISSRIYINNDFNVTIASLWKELIPLVKELGYINTNNKNESEVRKDGTDV